MTEIHILNGDALKEQLPGSINGQIIVVRECLVDGDFSGVGSLEQLFQQRAEFMHQAYGASIEGYHKKAVTEFDKIRQLAADSTVHLWFEDDLFCQVNFWFCCHLIDQYTEIDQVYLIRPDFDHRYGFGGMSQNALLAAFGDRMKLAKPDIEIFNQLWLSYLNNKFDDMTTIAEQHQHRFSFLGDAIQAHIDRFPADRKLGRPQQAIKDIIDEIGVEQFGPVFKEFWRREAVYGFGDMQVKRIFNQIRSELNI